MAGRQYSVPPWLQTGSGRFSGFTRSLTSRPPFPPLDTHTTPMPSVITSKTNNLLDWAEDMKHFRILRDKRPRVFFQQCWIKEFPALNTRLVRRKLLHDEYPQGGLPYLEMLQETLDNHGTAPLSLTIYDSLETCRKEGLIWLQDKEPDVRRDVMQNMATLSKRRNTDDPEGEFPAVATPEFLASIDSDDQLCHYCKASFDEGTTMYRNYCSRHFTCSSCLSKYPTQAWTCNSCSPFAEYNSYGRYESFEDVWYGRVSN